MAAALLTTLSLAVLGLPVTLALDRRARGPLLVGAAFLYGSGLVFFVLLALSVVHVAWTIPTVTIVSLTLWVAAWYGSMRARGEPRAAVRPHWLDGLTILIVAGYALYTTLAALSEWDFWAIWGLKARVFFEHGGIDWRFLESPWNVFAHPDYPLLLPFNYDLVAIANGAWSDRWLGVLLVAFAAAALLVVRGLLAEEAQPMVAALITVTVATIAASRYVGLAEGPLIAFGGAAVLFLRRAILFDDAAAWRHGAVLLGLAANVKNEGIALAVSVAIALAILRPRTLWRLWSTAAVAAPWLMLRAAHDLPTDIVGGSVVSRVLERLPRTGEIARLLYRDLYGRGFWLAIVAGIIVAPAGRRKREAFVLLVTAVQLAFYVGSYFATPHDPQWHIVTSWPRLTMQLALPLTVAVLMMLAISFARDAEARPVD